MITPGTPLPLRAALSILALTWVALVSSCGDSSGPKGPGNPAAVEITGGQGQQGVVGKELPEALSVRVLDADGRAVPNATITFHVVQGGGTIAAEAVVSNAEGIATTRWTLGTSASEPQRVEVRGVNPETGAPIVFTTFTATPTPDAPSALTKVGGDSQQGIAGSQASEQLAVRVTDQYGNPVPGVTVSWAPAQGSGSTNPTTSVTDATGTARTTWILGGTGPQFVTATLTGLVTPAVFSATISPAAPASISIYDGHNRTVLIESVTDTPPTVMVRDAFGNPVPGVEVTFAVTSGGGSLSATSGITDGNGRARAGAWTVGSQPGTNTVSATAAGLSGSPLTFTATAQAFIVQSISVGGSHTCAIVAGAPGTHAYCWGNNEFGQLGDETNTNKSKPTLITSFLLTLKFRDIQAGYDFTCALTTGDATWCWGRIPDRGFSTNEPLGSVHTLKSLSAGHSHACGLEAEGWAYCWGRNAYGQLGTGDTNDRPDAHPVTGGHKWKKIVAGWRHTCAIEMGDDVYCWGSSERGQLGNGETSETGTIYTRAQQVLGGMRVKDLTVGRFPTSESSGSHTCVLALDGKAYCWGSNVDGALGNGSFADAGSPQPVAGGLTFESISAGPGSTCAVQSTGAAYCWGRGPNGGPPRTQPTLVPGGISWDKLASGENPHNCGRSNTGIAFCWGNNTSGQTATVSDRNTPGPVKLP